MRCGLHKEYNTKLILNRCFVTSYPPSPHKNALYSGHNHESLLIAPTRDEPTIRQAAFKSLPGCTTNDGLPLYETRHYYVNVEKCLLDLMIRPVGVTYQSGIGKSTLIKSWSMRYTKTRRRPQVSLTTFSMCLRAVFFFSCLHLWSSLTSYLPGPQNQQLL